MDIEDFISEFRNHPVLFMGTGISLRYYDNSYTWDGLLAHISEELSGDKEKYLDIKSKCEREGGYDYAKIASELEKRFNEVLEIDRYGKFSKVNDEFYKGMTLGKNISRFKIYLSQLLSGLNERPGVEHEINCLKSACKNVSSIITTNYDRFCESNLDFTPLVGNDILLSSPYGSIYKIHGCVTQPERVIITTTDYERFNNKYELIRAQLLSIFMHNPIVFLGYSISDENIKSILRTIFSYVDVNSPEAEKVKDNFLLVEYEPGSNSREVVEHDIDIEGISIIRINKIKTDDFSIVYESISNLSLPVSAMDVRKVQNVVKQIAEGGEIRVKIADDFDRLSNSDMVVAIGSSQSTKYAHKDASDFIADYFSNLETGDKSLISLIDDIKITKSVYFPIYRYSRVCPSLKNSEMLKEYQDNKLSKAIESMPEAAQSEAFKILDILEGDVPQSLKVSCILWNSERENIKLIDLEELLKDKPSWFSSTDYRKLLCSYDRRFVNLI